MAATVRHCPPQADCGKRRVHRSTPYLPPLGSVLLLQAAVNLRYGPVFGALAVINWGCFLRLGETTMITVANSALPACIWLWNSKTGEEGYAT